MSGPRVDGPAGSTGSGSGVDFVMPSLGSDMDEGTVTSWLVGVGDEVTRGQLVAVVETDKADIDVEVWHDGVVTDILVETGRPVPVGTPLARLRVGGGSTDLPAVAPTAAAPAGPSAGGPVVPSAAVPMAPSVVAPAARSAGTPIVAARVLASPLARRLAADRGLDLVDVVGSGPGGAVVARDLEHRDAKPLGGSPAPSDRMRRAIADLMARANRDIPHYHLAETIDLEPMLVHLETLNADRSLRDRILPAAAQLLGVARALTSNPELNGFWVDGRFQPGDGIHLGVAIALRGGGLVAPAIRDADQLGLDTMMAALRDLVERARAGRLRGAEMTSATATVTNLGDRGAEMVNGLIHPPQVVLVGFGRIVLRPAVVDGDVVARRQVIATVAADHRASDGQRGSRFLNDLNRYLSDPEEMR